MAKVIRRMVDLKGQVSEREIEVPDESLESNVTSSEDLEVAIAEADEAEKKDEGDE